jgi:DNA-binding PadR family transcriptional regulator
MSASFSAADELARGRKFSSAELQTLLLALLGDEPRHGYQLMRQIEARSNGCYRPSAGVVYPALGHLEQAGYLLGVAAGKRKRYRLTEAGRRQVEASRQSAQVLWAKLDSLGQKMALVRRAFAHDEARSQSDARGSGPSVVAAFETLQALVLAGEQGSPEEQRRIVAALERAAQEILAATSPGMDRPV